MSVLDRQQTTPDAPPPSADGPSRGVPWVGVLIGFLVIGLIVVGTYLLWPQPQAAPQSVTSPEISIPETYPEAPEEKDIEAAKAGYMAYVEVNQKVGSDGRLSDDLEDLKEVTTGKAFGYEKAEAKTSAKNRWRFDGKAEVTIKGAKLGSNGTVALRVCIDQSERTAVDKKGKKVDLQKWISSKSTMKKIGNTWKMSDRDDAPEEKPCV